jgi:hypothetical protein
MTAEKFGDIPTESGGALRLRGADEPLNVVHEQAPSMAGNARRPRP